MKPQTDFMLDSQSHEFPESEAQGHFAFIGESGSGKTVFLPHWWETAFQDLGHGSVVWDPAQDMLEGLMATFEGRLP